MFKTKKTRSESDESTRTFASSDVSRIAQVSLRQLQWWDERKVVSPRHEGHKRVYQSEEVIEITVIAELRRKGFSLQKIRRVLRVLQREMGKRLADVLQSQSDLDLVTDGKSIYPEDKQGRSIYTLKTPKHPLVLVPLSEKFPLRQDSPRRKHVTAEAAAAPSG